MLELLNTAIESIGVMLFNAIFNNSSVIFWRQLYM